MTVVDDTSRSLARTLLDRDLAHPVWDGGPPRYDDPEHLARVTMVVPVRDRPDGLRRLLTEVPAMLRVVVVDDGSRDEHTVARIAQDAGATLVRHPVSRGPAAARNAGLAATHTPFVVFVDSDVVPQPGWVSALFRHFDDPSRRPRRPARARDGRGGWVLAAPLRGGPLLARPRSGAGAGPVARRGCRTCRARR